MINLSIIMNICYSLKKTNNIITYNSITCVTTHMRLFVIRFLPFSFSSVMSIGTYSHSFSEIMYVEKRRKVLIPLPAAVRHIIIVLIDPLHLYHPTPVVALSECLFYISDVPCSGQVKSFTCDAFH